MRPARAGLGLLLTAAASNAFAHGAIKGFGSFAGGVIHPLIEPAHLVALVTLALMVGQRGIVPSKWTLIALSACAALGLLVASQGTAFGTDGLVLAAACVAGLAVMAARPLPAAVCALLGGAIGLGIGLGTDPEGLKAGAIVASQAGTWLGASFSVLSAGTLISEARHAWMRILVRVAASWMTAVALLVLALRLTARA